MIYIITFEVVETVVRVGEQCPYSRPDHRSFDQTTFPLFLCFCSVTFLYSNRFWRWGLKKQPSCVDNLISTTRPKDGVCRLGSRQARHFVTASCGFRDAVCYPGIARVPPRKLERGRNGYLQPRSTLASRACIHRVHRSIDACVNIYYGCPNISSQFI